MKVILLTFVLALAMGCVSPPPLPTATPVPFLARQLDVKIDPKEAASYLLNPSPLGKGGYSLGMIVTIDILPKQGWQVEEWVGPVFNIDGTTAQIQMDSSQTVAVRLKLPTPPTATSVVAPPTSTSTPTPTDTPKPTYTPFPTEPPTPALDASSYHDEGMEYMNAANWSMAIEQFTLAVLLNAQLEDAYFSRAYAYGQLGQYQLAVQDYDKAIQLDPKHAMAYNNRGYTYSLLGQHQRAILDVDKSIELYPSAEAYHSRAFAYAGLGQHQRAIGDYDLAIQFDPNVAIAYTGRGAAYDALGQHAKADADKAKACSLDRYWC